MESGKNQREPGVDSSVRLQVVAWRWQRAQRGSVVMGERKQKESTFTVFHQILSNVCAGERDGLPAGKRASDAVCGINDTARV